MAVTTPEEFLALLGKSKALEPEQFAARRKAVRGVAAPKQIARELVRRGDLTLWQANQLLAGRHTLRLGKYRLLDHVGTGEVDRMFLAEHTQMNRQVTLQVLKQRHTGDDDAIERFLADASTIASLDHRNLVHVYDVESEGDRCYLVMEHVDGNDLQHAVESNGPLPYEQVADYLKQAAAGLAHLYSHDLVHGDIKPGNLLADRQGTLKIIGFGAVRHTGKGERRTEDLLYASSEQALGSKVDHRTDLFSLGCCGFFMLTGHPPFPGSTYAERIEANPKLEPPDVLAERPEVPESLVNICRKMISNRPEDRHESADEVVKLLEQWQEKNTPEMLERAAAEERSAASGDPSGSSSDRDRPAKSSSDDSSMAVILLDEPTPVKKTPAPVAAPNTVAANTVAAPQAVATAAAVASAASSPRIAPSGKHRRRPKKSAAPMIAVAVAAVLCLVIVGVLLSGLGSGQPEQPARIKTNKTKSPLVKSIRKTDPTVVPTKKTAPQKIIESPRKTLAGTEQESPKKVVSPLVDSPQKSVPPVPANVRPKSPEEQPAPVDPLRLVPVINLSLLKKGTAPEGPIALGTVAIHPDVKPTVELLGGNLPFKGGLAFYLEEAGSGKEQSNWDISMSRSRQGDTATTIASVILTGGKLSFEWSPDAADQYGVNYLRNCLLQISAGEQADTIRLRRPHVIVPTAISLMKSGNKFEVKDTWVPSAKALKIRVHLSDGAPAHVVTPKTPFAAEKGHASFDFGDVLFLEARASKYRRPGVVITSRMKIDKESKPIRIDLKEVERYSQKSTEVQTKLPTEKFNLQETINLEKDLEKRAELGKKMKTIDRILAQAKTFLDRTALIKSTYDQLNGTVLVHFRISYMVGDREVTLVTTEPTEDEMPVKAPTDGAKTSGKNAPKAKAKPPSNPFAGFAEVTRDDLQRITNLDITAARLTAAQAKAILAVRTLETLRLPKGFDPKVIGGYLALKKLPKLKNLMLKGATVSDAHLANLAGIATLEFLDLTDTQITDAGLEHLAGMKGIQFLTLTGTAVSEAGVEELRRQLPGRAITK